MADGIEVGRAHVTITADGKPAVRQVQSDFGRGMPQVGQQSGKQLGGGILAAASKFAAPLAALFAAQSVGKFFVEANAEARESQKVNALTAQVIKTTGGAAKITASQIGDLATAISNKSGRDDEAIQSGANLLLTFTNVRNEVGKGNDIFNQATQTVTDMSAALGQDTKSSAIQLGKALNDPVKGVTALQRVGVSFTEDQKKQIATLVKSGRTLDAQKLILGELSKEFGGAAAASATAGEKMSVAFGNFKEQVGTALLPLLDKVATLVSTTIIPTLSRFVSFLSANAGPALARVQASLAPFIAGLRGVASSGTPAAGFLQTKLVPAIRGLVSAGSRLAAVVLPIVRQIAAAFAQKWPVIRPLVVGIFRAIGGIVTDVMRLIQNRIRVVTAVISAIWARWGKQITAYVVGTFTKVLGTISGVMKIVGGIVRVITGVMTGDWRRAGSGIRSIVSGLKTVVVSLFGSMASKLNAAVKKLMGDIKDKFKSGVDKIGTAWDKLKDKAKEPIRFVVNTVINDGLIAAFNKIAKAVGAGELDKISLPKGFYSGGYTGKLDPRKVAGVVHGREYVFDADTVARAGGPAVMDRWRSVIKAGRLSKLGDVGIPGYSAGGFVNALSYAKRHAGHPYQFGTIWDCSGFISALQSIIYGQSPHRRWATPAFAGGPSHAQGFTRNKRSAFMIGVDPRSGRFGHTAGTLLGTNVESAGGVGVRVGGSARGWNNGYFPLRYGLDAGGGLKGSWEAIKAFVAAGFASIIEWFKSLLEKPLARLKEITSSPLGSLTSAAARTLAAGMTDKVKGFAGGGIARPGWAMVGENGRELMYTPGSQIYSNPDTERILGSRQRPIQQIFPQSMDPMTAAAVAGSRVLAVLDADGWGLG